MTDLEAIRARANLYRRMPASMLSRAQSTAVELLAEVDRLNKELRLAEEGLVNYAQEVERLKTENANMRAVIDSRDRALGFEELSPHPKTDRS